jgi:Xaa-Pro aminopeptidase
MLPHPARRTRLIESLPDTVDAMLISSLVNIRYLTGFTGSNAALLVPRDGDPLVATDGRYVTQIAAEAPDVECVESRTVGPALAGRARARRLRRLGIEAAVVTIAGRQALLDVVGDAVDLIAMDPLVEPLRAVKDDQEIERLATACAITDAAFADVITRLRPGVTELDVSWWLVEAFRAHGAEGAAFESIVAFGPHSAIPHHRPTDRKLAEGDLVKLDIGARYAGYHADMTRTIVVGAPTTWQRDLHATVAGIQAGCVADAVVGAVPAELDRRCTEAIEASGHRAAHGLGHGVGLVIHEDPFLTPGSTAGPLVDHSVVTVEPGIYLPDLGGVRVEDTVVIESRGPRVLTVSSRELLEVG